MTYTYIHIYIFIYSIIKMYLFNTWYMPDIVLRAGGKGVWKSKWTPAVNNYTDYYEEKIISHTVLLMNI